nr:hypothetical protein [uncultured Oscillibacter sp.]
MSKKKNVGVSPFPDQRDHRSGKRFRPRNRESQDVPFLDKQQKNTEKEREQP